MNDNAYPPQQYSAYTQQPYMQLNQGYPVAQPQMQAPQYYSPAPACQDLREPLVTQRQHHHHHHDTVIHHNQPHGHVNHPLWCLLTVLTGGLAIPCWICACCCSD